MYLLSQKSRYLCACATALHYQRLVGRFFGNILDVNTPKERSRVNVSKLHHSAKEDLKQSRVIPSFSSVRVKGSTNGDTISRCCLDSLFKGLDQAVISLLMKKKKPAAIPVLCRP